MALLNIDPMTIEALILSHGHYDHFSGLAVLPGHVHRGTPLYIGREEAFCARLRGISPDGPDFGHLRNRISAAGLDLRVVSEPQSIAGATFTTSRISFVASEHPKVPTAMLPGQGCNRSGLDADRRDLDFFVGGAIHEIDTAFHLRGKGLVVIGSCSHRGIINTVHAAQAVSGIERVHAVIGGFHRVPP